MKTNSHIVFFETHGGGGTNYHAETKEGKYYTILSAKEAKDIKLSKNPIIISHGCNAAAIDKIGEGGEWNNWQYLPATEDKIVMYQLIRNGAAAFIGNTGLAYSSVHFPDKYGKSSAELISSKKTIGEAFSTFRNSFSGESRSEQTNKYGYQLYGDPTLIMYN